METCSRTQAPLHELEGRPYTSGLIWRPNLPTLSLLFCYFPPVDDDPFYHVHARYYLPDIRVLEALDVNFERYQQWDTGLLLNDG